MIDPSSLRFAGRRCSFGVACMVMVALTLWTATAARAQSDPPLITANPQSLTVTQGMSASFSVTATGTEPLVYQWFRNSTNLLDGATNSTLVLTSTLPADAASYHVLVTNQFGTATSLVATLTVVGVADLAVTATASGATVAVGSSLTFTLNVTNRGPSEATNLMLVCQLSPNVQYVSSLTTRGACTNDGGTVTCLVSNLSAGARFTAAIDTRAGPGTNLCSATITASQLDPVPVNNLAVAASLGTRTFAPFQNSEAIILDEILGGPGSIYPSIINVSGVTTRVHKVTVTLHGLAHSFPDDLDVLLVGPGGKSVLLMSDCGLNNAISDVTLTFDDEAPGFLPDSDPPIVSGTYRPSNCFSSEDLPPPAPPRPYGSQLSVFGGANPNGNWSLFVEDDLPESGGFVAEGWSLNLVTSDPIADLVVTQTANAANIPVGSNLVYTVSVTNLGPASTTATVVDTLPPSVNFVSVLSSQGSCSNAGNLVTCLLNNMNSSSGASITIVVVPTLGGQITNRASVNGPFIDNAAANNTSSLVTTILPVSDVAIVSATGAGSGLLLQPYTYSIQATNYGPNVAANSTVTDTLPPGMIFVSATASQGNCAYAAGVVTCSLGSLPPGGGGAVTIVGQPGLTGLNTNRIQIAASVLDHFPSNDLAEVVTGISPAADFAVFATPPVSSVLFGQNWSQTLQVSNLGPSTAGATLTVTLAPQVQFISAVPSQGACSNAINTVFCDLSSVAATQSVSIALVTRPATLGSFTNQAVVTGAFTDQDMSNNLVRSRASVVANGDVELRSRVAIDPVWLGENASFLFTITNHGPNNATSVLLTNTLPPAFSFVFATPSQGGCFLVGGNTINCSLGNLPAGAAASVTIVGRAVAAGLVTDTARVTALELDAVPSNNDAILPIRVVSNSGRFTNAASVVINEVGTATPYPSTIQVSGLTAAVFRVRVTLTNLVHTYPDDLDILLVGPEGQSVVLMSDAGGEFSPGSVNLTFDEDSASPVADSAVLQTGIFRPANYELAPDVWPPPAPAGPYGTNLNVFRDTNPNGLWSLYVVDDATKDSGILSSGWALTFSTLEPIADVLVTQTFSANPVAVGSNFVVSCRVTNQGPATATNIWVTNVVNPALSLVGATPSQGTAAVQNAQIVCNLGALTNGGVATVLIQSVPLTPTTFTNRVTVGAAQRDMRPGNNASEATVEIEIPPSITLHPASVTVTNGDSVVFMGAGTGMEPLRFQWQRNGVNLADATNTTLMLSNVTPNNSGRYRLLAINLVGVASSDEALLRVLGPPTVSDIPDQVIVEDTATSFLSFTVEDAESPAELILVHGISSDTNVVADSGIVITGTGSNRNVRVTPLHNAFGQVTISVVAEDPDGSVTTKPFVVNILPINDPPAISDVGDLTVAEDVPAVVNFLIDDETLPDQMLYWITSSNPVLVPTDSVVFGGVGAARVATITPATNESGVAVITLHAQDAEGDTVSDSFLLTVFAVNDPPTLDFINDLAIDEDSGTHELILTGITSGATNEPQQLILSASSDHPALLPAPSITYTNPSNTAQITFAPLTNANGVALITVTVRDGDTTNQTFSRTFTVTVNPVNDPPVIAPIPPVSSPEDQVHSVAIALSDPDDDAAAITLVARSLNQSLVPDAGLVPGGSGPNRSLQLTPAPDAFGATTVEVIATDPHGAATTNSFGVTITPLNDPPRLDAILGRTIPEDAPTQSIPLTGIRPGPTNESGPVAISAVSSNPVLIPNPSVLYTNPATTGALSLRPATDATGMANITVTLTDDEGAQFSRTFGVTVTATNDAPVIAIINDQSTPEDTPIDVPVTVGDPDTPAPLLTLSAVSGNTTLVPNAGIVMDGSGSDRTVRITPAPNQSGNANITVFATDGTATNSRTFQLTVISSNDPPTLNVLTNMNLQISPGPLSLPLTGITAGPAENQALSVTVSNSNPGFFQNPPNANYNSPSTSGTLSLRVANNLTGSAVVTVTVTDNGAPAASFSRSFVVNVRSLANTQPTISIITNQFTAEDTPTAAIPFTIRDAETPAASLTLSATSSNPILLPDANIALGNAGTNRTITLTPEPDQSGVAAITLTVTDTAFGVSNMTFNLTVGAVNDPPFISSINSRSTLEDLPIEVPFTVSDVETPAGNLGVTAESSNQGIVPNAGIKVGGGGGHRALVITPALNQTGVVSIAVHVTDGSATNNATFQLTVIGVNDPPVISDIGDQTTGEDTPLGPIQFVVGDPESGVDTLTLTATSSNPALVLDTGIVFGGGDSNRTVTVTPQPNTAGSAVITVTVTDPGGASATDSFALTVIPVNDPPTLDPIAGLVVNQNSGPQIVGLTGLTAGPGESNQTLSVSVTTLDTNLVRILSVDYAGGATAALTLAPVQGALGVATVTVVVNDGQASNNLASQSFTVTLNAAPVISYVPDQTTLEGTPTAPIPFRISDAESTADQLTVTVTSASPMVPPGHVTLIGTGADRALIISPAASLTGVALVSIAVADPQGASNTLSFHLIVVHDAPPTILPISDQTTPEDIAITVPLTIADAETPNGPFTLSGSSSSSIVQASGITFGGSGANRTVRIVGLADLNGPTVITLQVTDLSGLRSTNSFNLFIMPVQDHVQILEQPQSVVVPPGGTARFNVRATGGSTLMYQWRKNGINLPGETNSTLTIFNARMANEGAYTVFIRNEDLASEESAPAQLTVFAVVQILDIRWLGSTATITYAAPQGSTNTLEFKRPITSTSWFPVASQVVTGEVMTVIDPTATDSNRFYRIRNE